MTTLDEKQNVPASNNTTPNNRFVISQVLHFTNEFAGGASTDTMEESGRTSTTLLYHLAVELDAAPRKAVEILYSHLPTAFELD
jgi:hypothetical protein